MKFIPLAAKFAASKKVTGYPVHSSMVNTEHIFVLSDNTALEVEKLSLNKTFFTHPRDLHLPFPKVFVEMPITDEIRAMRRVAGEKEIVRVGAQISESPQGGSFSFWPMWEFDDGTLGFGLTVVLVNAPEELRHSTVHFIPDDPNSIVNVVYIPSAPLISHMANAGIDPLYAAKMFHSMLDEKPVLAMESVEEIAPLLMAWTTIVNCRTGITKTHIKRVKPKAAGKRSAVLNGTSYTVITLNAVENVDAEGVVTARTDLAAHYVRGHFKKRATGMFWWQPFIRGSGAVKKREAYFVRETSQESIPA